MVCLVIRSDSIGNANHVGMNGNEPQFENLPVVTSVQGPFEVHPHAEPSSRVSPAIGTRTYSVVGYHFGLLSRKPGFESWYVRLQFIQKPMTGVFAASIFQTVAVRAQAKTFHSILREVVVIHRERSSVHMRCLIEGGGMDGVVVPRASNVRDDDDFPKHGLHWVAHPLPWLSHGVECS